MMETAYTGYEAFEGVVFSAPNALVHCDSQDPREQVDFLRVSSAFYPQLGDYYERAIQDWADGLSMDLDHLDDEDEDDTEEGDD